MFNNILKPKNHIEFIKTECEEITFLLTQKFIQKSKKKDVKVYITAYAKDFILVVNNNITDEFLN